MKPLDGVRVLEFDGLGPVTFAAMMLADMGAEVVRLTRAATSPAAAFDDVGGAILHRGRAVEAVDLKSEAGRARVLDLARTAHVTIEGFRPGVLERLGLGPETLWHRNPALVIGRVTGWGQDGPLAHDVGHDINYLALSGALSMMGEPDRSPRPPLNLVADYGGGAMMLVAGVLAGVIEARRTGRGRVVDAAMVEGAALMTSLFQALGGAGLWQEERGVNLLDGGAPFYRCYECRDGRFVAVGALEPRFFAALLRGLGLSDQDWSQHDRAAWPNMLATFERVFATLDRDEWEKVFAGTEACVTPVLTLTEAPRHPHNLARAASSGGGPMAAPRFGPAVGSDQAAG